MPVTNYQSSPSFAARPALRPTLRPVWRALLLTVGLLAATVPTIDAAASPLSWLSGDRVQGSGNLTRQTRQVDHFTGLALGMGGNVEVRLGAMEGVTVETDDNLQSLIETTVDNGTLRIRPLKRDMRLEPHALRIVVQARTMERLAVTGSGTVVADGLHGQKLAFDVAGSGSILANRLDGESVAVSLAGSGTLRAGGKADRLQVSVGGSGQVQAGKLAARDVTASVSGSGQAQVWAREALNVNVVGSGDIGYYGDPRLTTSVLGSGSVKRLGAAPQ
ncbi:MAG: head GIN domain-containing protein [Pseudomonadota bacterium]